jgi:CRP/FNR family transcriptional regulator, cyclic AMP receptor protein
MINFSLFRNSETKDFAQGEKIFTAGEEGKMMYFVTEGEVDILVGSIVTETVTSGGIFGEMALIDQNVRSADAVARTNCKLVPVDQRRFQFMVSETPFFALEVMSIMAQRLRHVNELMIRGQGAGQR